MSDYRIIKETERSGKETYYVQKRFLLYFWRYLREYRDIGMYHYRINCKTKEEAEALIQQDVNNDYERSQRKVKEKVIL